jgi:D-isomer specific 2-hydroxyacid dehydrogenase, NAD binding domain
MPRAPEATLLLPSDTARLVNPGGAADQPDVWAYRYLEPASGWRLSIATCAPPDSGKLSLGGFRIATDERTSSPGFDSDREAISLAIGMDEKVHWSRLLGIGGPLALRHAATVVGGKCVLHPTPDARMGQPHDTALLDFAISCLLDAESRGGFSIITGQDLGHGIMSDGATSSLHYLNARFKGSVVADTSRPTGEGNFVLLAAMLRALDIAPEHATVGLIGCGNVGTRVLSRLRDVGVTVLALDSSATRRAEIEALGIRCFAPDEKPMLLRAPLDALVVNAAGGSLDRESVMTVAGNPRLQIVCGSENLAMSDAAGVELLRAARKAYAPTELGGMMGYLTALEEYLARVAGVPFDIDTMVTAATHMADPIDAAMRLLRERNFAISFDDALKAVCVRV